MGYLSVDRIAGDFAFCEDENRVPAKIPLSKLPPNIREGSVIRLQNGAYALDEAEEARRRRQNHALFTRLSQGETADCQ